MNLTISEDLDMASMIRHTSIDRINPFVLAQFWTAVLAHIGRIAWSLNCDGVEQMANRCPVTHLQRVG